MLAVFAKKGFDVIGLDLNSDYVDAINRGIAPVAEPQLQEFITENRCRIRATTDTNEAIAHSDVTFIIVPTPSGQDRFFKNDYVIAALKNIGSAIKNKSNYHNVIVTSTVMPGSTGGVLKETLELASGRKVGDNLGLCYNPEFIALGTVVRDMLFPDMILIGESDVRAGNQLEEIYRASTESNPEFQRMNWVNAELCKIAVNTYVTTKISYANMIADMCDHLPGADSDVVTLALGADSRIGKKYIKGAIGYGGPCFPRDNKAFAALGDRLGVATDLAKATDSINDHQTQRLLRAVTSVSQPLRNVVTILGLSYKPNTPVTEESQGLSLARSLVALGYRVRASDPEALVGLSEKISCEIELIENSASAINGADVLVIMTPWLSYKTLDFNSFHLKAIVDPWRIVDPDKLDKSVALIRPGVGDWVSMKRHQ